MRKGILRVDVYEGAEVEFMLGMFAALSEYHIVDSLREDFVLYVCDAIWSDGHIINYFSQNSKSMFLLNSETCALHCAMSCPVQPYT